MSFFGGFAKGFADGYNADVAAKKAAELEREKYVATLKLKNKLETDQAIDLATVDFGKIIGQNNNVEHDNFSFVKNYTDTNQFKKSMGTLNNLNTALQTKNEFGISPLDTLVANPEGNAAVISKIKNIYQANHIFVKDRLNKELEDQVIEYNPENLPYYNNPLFKGFDAVVSVEQHNQRHPNDRVQITGDVIHQDFENQIKNSRGSYYKKEEVNAFIANANKNFPGKNVIRDYENRTKALKNEGIETADFNTVLSLGMRLNPLLKGNVSSADIDNVVQNIRKEPEYQNISLIDLQSAIAFSFEDKPTIYSNRGDFIYNVQSPSYGDIVKESGREMADSKAAYKKASDVYNRVGRTLGLIKETENDLGAVPVGIFQTVEIGLRGLADAANQGKTVINSLLRFGQAAFGGAVNTSYYTTPSEGRGNEVTDKVYTEMMDNLDNANLQEIKKIKQKYLEQGMSEKKFYETVSAMSLNEDLEVQGFDRKDVEKIKASNTALIQYHSFLLAFDMAAAIQGGGDSRTISDKDVRIMARAISGALKAGADYKEVLREIQRNMQAAREYHEVYLHADDNKSKALLKSADILTNGVLANNFTGFTRQFADDMTNKFGVENVNSSDGDVPFTPNKVEIKADNDVNILATSNLFTTKELGGQKNLGSWARITTLNIDRQRKAGKDTKAIQNNIVNVYEALKEKTNEDVYRLFPELFPSEYRSQIQQLINQGDN
jgi:hypothetical protein